MASVTFPVEFGGSGITITDDADPQTGLDGTGYITRFVPALQQSVVMTGYTVQKAAEAQQAATTATTAAQQASDDRDSINLDLQALNGLVADADASADAAAGSATTASNMADAVAEATATYTSVSAGLAATVDTNYFRVIEAPEAERINVYRNDAGSATLITTYYTKSGVDAKQAAAVRLNRSLQRLGDNGQTLHSDFNLAAYGLGSQLSGGVQEGYDAEELWDVERLSGTYALQHVADGSLKYVEVPANTIAREWNPETGKYQAQISGAVTNERMWSIKFDESDWIKERLIVSTTGIASPIASGNVFKLVPTSDDGRHILQGNITAEPDTEYSLSIIAKAAEFEKVRLASANLTGWATASVFEVDLTDGSILSGSGEVISLGNGFYRLSTSAVTGTGVGVGIGVSPINAANSITYQGDGTSGIYIAHAQLVQGTTPGPLIVTEDAPVTRAADNVSRELGAEFNASGFTLLLSAAEVAQNASDPFGRVFDFSYGTSSNRLLSYKNSSGGYSFIGTYNGAQLFSTSSQSISGDVSIAVSYSIERVIIVVNGVVVRDEENSEFSEYTALAIGCNSYNFTNHIGYAAFNLCELLPLTFTAAQLQELTTP